MKIWCLFGVENNYDQPDNNLVAWWPEKPSIEKLASFLCVKLGEDNERTVAIVQIWTGNRMSLHQGCTSYRLEEISEGGV